LGSDGMVYGLGYVWVCLGYSDLVVSLYFHTFPSYS